MQMVPQPSFNGGYTRSFDSSYQGESGYTTGIEDNLLALQDVSVVQQNFNATNCNVGNVWNFWLKVAQHIQNQTLSERVQCRIVWEYAVDPGNLFRT